MATIGIFGNIHEEAASYVHSHEKFEFEKIDVLRPLIVRDTVFAVQALAMGLLRHRTRTKMTNRAERKYGFAILNATLPDSEEAYDGTMEEYLSYRVKKVDHDEWQMRVRFRQNERTEVAKRESYIDDYLFNWDRNNHMAWTTNRRVTAYQGHTYEDIRSIEPLDEAQALVLRQRMAVTVGAVNPLQEDSIYNSAIQTERLKRLTDA